MPNESTVAVTVFTDHVGIASDLMVERTRASIAQWARERTEIARPGFTVTGITASTMLPATRRYSAAIATLVPVETDEDPDDTLEALLAFLRKDVDTGPARLGLLARWTDFPVNALRWFESPRKAA